MNKKVERQVGKRQVILVRAALISMIFLLMPLAVGAEQAVSSPQQQPTAAVDVVHLTPDGCFPKQVTVSHGRHLLWVHNATGLRNFTLNLSLTGPIQKQQSLTPSHPHWKELLDLTPGKYTITEAAHPSWVCSITVQ